MAGAASGRTVNPRGQGGRLRAELLEAADRLLATGGRDTPLTLRSVAREAEVAAPSVYDHFDSLEALLRELEGMYRNALVATIGRSLARAAAGPVTERLRAVARAYVRWGLQNPGAYALVISGRAAHRSVASGDLLPEAGQQVVHLITDLLREREPPPARPRAVALALWCGLHGLVDLRAVAGGYSWPSPARHLDAILGGVLGPPGADVS